MIDRAVPLASLLAACMAATPLRELSEADANGAFDVRIGQPVTITLHAQLGTGFRWIAQPATLVTLSERTLQGADRPGGEERQVFDAKPVAAGTTKLEFDYRRSWMPDEAPAKRYRVTLRIHAGER